MADLWIRRELRGASDGVAEVLDVQRVVHRFEFHGDGRWLVAVGEDFQLASTAQVHLPFGAIEFGTAVGVVRVV